MKRDYNMTTETEIEKEIQDKGLNAPRLSPEKIDAVIEAEIYFTAADAAREAGTGIPVMDNAREKIDSLECLTFCVLVLRNGFTVTGESACVSPKNYNEALGRKLARQHARDKIWALEALRTAREAELVSIGSRHVAQTCDVAANARNQRRTPA